jgi:hypothetical protein
LLLVFLLRLLPPFYANHTPHFPRSILPILSPNDTFSSCHFSVKNSSHARLKHVTYVAVFSMKTAGQLKKALYPSTSNPPLLLPSLHFLFPSSLTKIRISLLSIHPCFKFIVHANKEMM